MRLLVLTFLATWTLFAGEVPKPDTTLASEVQFTTEDSYCALPSPDGSKIAYVRTGKWDRGSGGFGRSNLRSEVVVIDTKSKPGGPSKTLVSMFLSGWTLDGIGLACYRDGKYCVVALDGSKTYEVPFPKSDDHPPERAIFLPRQAELARVWFKGNDCHLETTKGEIAGRDQDGDTGPGDVMAPSPDGRYLAFLGGEREWCNELWTLDFETKTWRSLGKATLHSHKSWDWHKPAWSPWFKDGSKVVFISAGKLIVATPDGKSREVIAEVGGAAALPAVSPDGARIAYMTFDAQPIRRMNDEFWGGTTLWVVPSQAGSIPRAVTKKAYEMTYGLVWVNNTELIFDRIPEKSMFLAGARLWKATLPLK